MFKSVSVYCHTGNVFFAVSLPLITKLGFVSERVTGVAFHRASMSTRVLDMPCFRAEVTCDVMTLAVVLIPGATSLNKGPSVIILALAGVPSFRHGPLDRRHVACVLRGGCPWAAGACPRLGSMRLGS